MNLQNAMFTISAGTKQSFVRDHLPQVAFAGRSNVGKSSVINRLLLRKNLARVGEVPGKTVHVNYFSVDGKFYLVDLPGYGYARVSKEEKERWAKLMEAYFAEADAMALGVMVVDSRHKPTENDVTMAEWFRGSGKPYVVVANKLDKLKKSEIEPNIAMIREALQLPETVRLLPFSAEKGSGREELLREVLQAVAR